MEYKISSYSFQFRLAVLAVAPVDTSEHHVVNKNRKKTIKSFATDKHELPQNAQQPNGVQSIIRTYHTFLPPPPVCSYSVQVAFQSF